MECPGLGRPPSLCRPEVNVQRSTPNESPPQLPTQGETQTLSNPLHPSPFSPPLSSESSPSRTPTGTVLTIFSVNFFSVSLLQRRRIQCIRCFLRYLRDRHGFYLTARTSTGFPCVFKLAILPSWRISPWKLRASLPFSLACSLGQIELDHFVSNLSRSPRCYNLVIISNLVGPRLYPSRSCSASTWKMNCLVCAKAADETVIGHSK